MINFIGFTRNKSDIKNAKNLIHKIFKGSEKQQNLILNNPDNINRNNLVILEFNKKIIGVIRLVRKKSFNQKILLKILGVSHVCISKRYRNKGYSKLLLNFAIKYGEKNKYDISLLFARKNVDKYYNKFGYFGVSSFPILTLQLIKKEYDFEKKLSIRDAKINDYTFLNQSYKSCYSRSNFLFKRSKKYWEYILEHSRLFKVDFKIILHRGKPILYVNYKQNEIYEFGGINIEHSAKFILHYLKMLVGKKIIFHVDPYHTFISFINSEKSEFKIRNVIQGGHMIKILNKNKFNNNSKKILNIYNKFMSLKKNKYNLDLLSLCETIYYTNTKILDYETPFLSRSKIVHFLRNDEF